MFIICTSTRQRKRVLHLLVINNLQLKFYILYTLCSIRLEHIKIRELRSQAKVIGTLVTFAGALLMTLYKGPQFDLFHHSNTTHQQGGSHTQNHSHWVAGTLFICLGCLAWSSFYILQVSNALRVFFLVYND